MPCLALCAGHIQAIQAGCLFVDGSLRKKVLVKGQSGRWGWRMLALDWGEKGEKLRRGLVAGKAIEGSSRRLGLGSRFSAAKSLRVPSLR